MRCDDGVPVSWVAADAHPSVSELICLGSRGSAAVVESDPGYHVVRRSVSMNYAVAVWGSVWEDVLIHRSVTVEGCPILQFLAQLRRHCRPSRRLSDRWFGIPLQFSSSQRKRLQS